MNNRTNYISDLILIKKDNLVATLPSWGKYFDISFYLWIDSFDVPNNQRFSELLRFTSTDKECCNLGDRLPAVFANSQRYIQVACSVGTDGNYDVNKEDFQTKTWTKFEIKQYPVRDGYGREKVMSLSHYLSECKMYILGNL